MTESTQKKRKWDLDDQGKSRSEGTASKITKVDDEFSNKASAKDQGEAAMNEATAKINAILAQKGISNKDSIDSYRDKADGEFVKNIPINDLKNRYMLTRGATQAQIQRDTGADVTTRGKYYPDKALATSDGEPPLYLHISASSKESLDKAIAQIEDLIANAAVPTVTPHHHQERRERKFLEEKIYVGMESSPNFNLRAKIVGPHGAYVKHIQNETGSRVQLKGKGSGFYETSTGQEAEDALHVHITCTREEGLEKAVQLTKDLINTVKQEYERGPKQYGGYYNRGGYGRGYGQQGGYGYQGGYGSSPPAPASSTGTPTSGADESHSATPTSSGYEGDANAQSYGGYDYNQYYQYYGQYQYDPNYYNYYYGNSSTATSQPGADGASYHQQQAPPPPPPPAEDSKGQSYNAVPPPPQQP